jgi:L-amino acid N-acyltransferase YncA
MASSVEMITVNDADSAAEHGFFCYKSKPKSDGYRRKLAWLEDRFAEGLQIRIVQEDCRSVGFIEYTPGEFAWRPVKAPGYLFVHCLWVVGRAKEKGYGSRLLNACVEDARAMGKHGVAALTRKGGHLVGTKLFLKHGFEALDRAPPSFELVARMFDHAPPPALPHDWDERAARYGEGLTVVYADQCPYFADAVTGALEAAEQFGVDARRAVELRSAREVQGLAPSPYGTFGIVYNGTLLAQTPLSAKKLIQRLEERRQEGHK